MSRYLIRRIEQSEKIVLHTRTEIVALEDDDHLARVTWRDAGTEPKRTPSATCSR